VTCYIFATGAEGIIARQHKVFEADVAMKTSKAAISASASIMDQVKYPSSLSLATAVSSPTNQSWELYWAEEFYPRNWLKKC